MTRATDRVRALADKGALDPREAERLLAAMSTARGAHDDDTLRARVLNPFARMGTGVGLLLATAIAVLGVGIALVAGVRFDGFLDLHVANPSSVGRAALDQLVAIVPATVVFWAAARIAAGAPGVRIVDFAVFVGVARAPIALLAGPIALVAPKLVPGTVPSMSFGLAAVLVLSLVAVAGHVTWLWQGFRTASGLAGGRAVGAFLAAIVASEIASKLLLSVAH